MASHARQYDIIVFGASGYTGQYCAEHITTHFPTNFSWAVAGRSHQKLSTVVQALMNLNSDRKQPGECLYAPVEVAQLNKDDLQALARKTKVLLNCVGPYMHYGEPVLQACAANGTHYLDVTGESPWVKEMVEKYHNIAKANQAIIIPQIGVESAPADMVTFALARKLREKGFATKEVVFAIHSFNGAASGGTLATALAVFSKYSLRQLAQSLRPSALCPISLSNKLSSPSLITSISGIRVVPDLGTLTTSIQGGPDIPIVYRSWGLLSSVSAEEFYGADFQFSPYVSVRNAFVGVLVHVAVKLIPILLAFPLLRWALSKVVMQPGQGPSRMESKSHWLEYRAVGIPTGQTPQKAFARMRWEGSAYHLTGVFLAEAAATILRDEKIAARRLGGGMLTPATLGQGFLDRIIDAGVFFELKMLDH